MAKSAAELIAILRNVTGRVDASDPLFTNEIMLQRINDFIALSSTQDIRIFKNRTWWTFTIDENSDDPYPVDLQAITLDNGVVGASTLEPPAYADGFYMFWYQNPAEFYGIWPQTQTYQPARPTYVLYYNNTLTFRNPPNTEYEIKIAAYSLEVQVDANGTLDADYLYRYVTYGAALDLFADFGEMDRYNEIYPVFMRYRALVYGRTASQYQNQRPSPEF